MSDAQKFLRDFPLLQIEMNQHPIVYLDNAATTQKPVNVIKALSDYYSFSNANPHRGAYTLSVEATEIYENARARVARFVGANRPEEIIFTKNATEALNLVAYSYALSTLKKGDEILISIAEHHSNLVPWQFVAKRIGAILQYIYLEDDGNLSAEDIETKITERTKIVAITQVSNVLGLKNDIKKIAAKAHSVGAVIVVDGAQSVAHQKVNVREIDADFFAFSGHKMLSSMGIGVLYGKYSLLDAMPPFLFGGDMIEYVQEQETSFAELPSKFEAGTQNVGGAAALSVAIDYLEEIGFSRIEAIEQELLNYALPKLRELPYVSLYGCDTKLGNKTGIIAFNVKDIHPHDVATILDSYGIAVRAGHHCAQPLHAYWGLNATCRISLYFYNTKQDIDHLIDGLQKVRGVLGYGN